MGCSVSRHENIISTDTIEQPSPLSSSSARPVSLRTPLVHYPPLKKGDTHHLVSLTSTSYGSLVLIDSNNDPPPSSSSSSSSDSIINTWELMADLEDMGEEDTHGKKQMHKRSTSSRKQASAVGVTKESSTKPLWQHLSEELILSQMDPNVGSSFRRALWAKKLGNFASSAVANNNKSSSSLLPAKEEDRIVIYYTSLRGIQKTYQDCCVVRTIFKGFRVPVDERDVSMDSSYRKQLQNALDQLNENEYSKGLMVSLPQVFIRGKHVGGADEIKQLHEDGELTKILQGFPVVGLFVCETCGDARFIPCVNCNGSRKVFHQEQGEPMRCLLCNENGLIRCPHCCH